MVSKTDGKIKEKKEEYLKGIEAEEKILHYLIQQNRPYNATDATNLKIIKKVEVTRCLNHLFENQKILMKSFGKQQIYCCLQSKEIPDSPEELKKIQTDLSKGKEELNSLKDQNRLLEFELNQLKNQPTSTQILIIQKSLTQQVRSLFFWGGGSAKEVIKTITENIEDEEIRNVFESQLGIEPDDPELIKLIDSKLEVQNRLGIGLRKRSLSGHLR
ncbi:Tat binding protein 1-interacting protein-domain-containing protein [Melampsora americana]|nr:Tat binding protein 1-interacting protein-domain-containing protein [Melampsora americana]